MSGKWFYVTGCDSGFGAIVVKLLEGAGHNVFAGCYLAETVKTLQAGSSTIVPFQLDVTNQASIEAAAKLIREKLGGEGLDGVVNNAAILVSPAPVELTPMDAFRRMYDVNVVGTVAVTQSVLPLIRRARGRIVNVASIAGRIGLPFQPAYCASKYAVEGFSDVLRIDMAPWGVTVHIIEPGVFPNTGLYDSFRQDIARNWQALPQNLKDEYGEAFRDSYLQQTEGALSLLGTKDSSYVPKAMVHALTSKKPMYRYRVGWDSKYIVTILSWLHEKTIAKLWYDDSPLQPKKIWPIGAPSDGFTSALKRMHNGNGKWHIVYVLLFWLWRRGHIWLRAKKW